MRLRESTPENLRLARRAEPVDVLRQTSRTFYFSIVTLPQGLREAVMSAYLSLRAIDEIEDHPHLEKLTKIRLLRSISSYCESSGVGGSQKLCSLLKASRYELPEVTNRLDEWLKLAPSDIASNIWSTNAVMSRRMAYWISNDWMIHTKADLDSYTFSVAGAVGLLLCDLWNWYDGTTSQRDNAVGFGRGLQAVNILRNRAQDLARGVDFFPDRWNEDELRYYATDNLAMADAYTESLPPGPARDFCRIPLSLAYATLDALARGEPKLSRTAVLEIVSRENASSSNHKTL